MKSTLLSALFFLLLISTLTSCEVVGDIFGAGVYTGMFVVVAIIIILIVVVSRIFKRK
jgi:hypothetical protein